MKNLSISKKLLVGFGTILAMMLITIGLLVVSINNINKQVKLYTKFYIPNNSNLWVMRRDLVSIQRDIFVALSEEDGTHRAEIFEKAQSDGEDLMKRLDEYSKNQRDNSRDKEIVRMKEICGETGSIRANIADLTKTLTPETFALAKELYEKQYIPKMDEVEQILINFTKTADERAITQERDAEAAVRNAWVVLIICTSITVALTGVMIYIIRQSIYRPVAEVASVYKEIAKGNKQVVINYESDDEIGQMAALIRETVQAENIIIADVIDKLTKMSQGDLMLNVDVDYYGDFAVLKEAIEQTVTNLNNTMNTIKTVSEQVSTGAEQVSSGAQALSTGATEQAASVEELNASVIEVANQASENSKQVRDTTKELSDAGARLNEGNAQMEQLIKAMTEINTSSNQIADITKTIEDIAFQTNILALNAAIEAARAGAAGKGFAVVADEVRNLAAKSAEAAKETADLIGASVVTVENGSKITNQTAQIIHDAVDDISEVIKDIGNVEQSSDQQTDAINQIREGLSQISSVVQTNAATSEENSAASEEMSSQAMALREEVAKFRLKRDTQHNVYINLDDETNEYSKEQNNDNFDISMF